MKLSGNLHFRSGLFIGCSQYCKESGGNQCQQFFPISAFSAQTSANLRLILLPVSQIQLSSFIALLSSSRLTSDKLKCGNVCRDIEIPSWNLINIFDKNGTNVDDELKKSWHWVKIFRHQSHISKVGKRSVGDTWIQKSKNCRSITWVKSEHHDYWFPRDNEGGANTIRPPQVSHSPQHSFENNIRVCVEKNYEENYSNLYLIWRIECPSRKFNAISYFLLFGGISLATGSIVDKNWFLIIILGQSGRGSESDWISPKSALNVRRKCSWVELAHNLGYIAPHQITTKDKCKFASL